jgi:cation diffusion facilitator CzcD-associated flavoprotein CzcO
VIFLFQAICQVLSLTAGQICEYLDVYARHFSLHQYIEFNTEIEKVVRNVEGTKWVLYLVKKGSKSTFVEYDKVVFYHGLYQRPITPPAKGSDLFKGRVIHSRSFKGLCTPRYSHFNTDEFLGQKISRD